jgi:hypothetical protein
MIQSYTITVPKSSDWEAARAYQFMEQMLFTFQSLTFQIVAEYDAIRWQIIDTGEREVTMLENAIRSSYPDAQIEVADWNPFRSNQTPTYRIVVKYQYHTPLFVAPIQQVDDIREPDPLANIVQAMSLLQPGERISYTVIVVGFADYAYLEGEKLITRNVYDGGLLGLAFPRKEDRYVPELQKVMLDKLQARLSQCLVMIQVDTPQEERLSSLCAFDSQMVHFDRPQFNGLRWVEENFQHSAVYVSNDTQDIETSAMGIAARFTMQNLPPALQKLRQDMRLILDAHELASLWHLPHSGFRAPTIRWAKHTQVELPVVMRGNRDGICLGINQVGGRSEPVFLPHEDRTTHCLIVGKTGVGKSNLLHQLIHQDILRGRGVVVIDPHGGLVRDILQCSIPPTREADVILLDLANTDYPIPLNLLRGLHGEVATGRMVSVLDKVYDDLATMPQTADALENALLTLQGDPQATLRDINRLFLDNAYRQRLLGQLQDDVALEFWHEDFGGMSESQQRQISAPVIRRIRAFYRNERLRAMLCHPDGLPVEAFIRQRKIILVSLKADETAIPAREQQLIGALILAQLQMAAMSGATRESPLYAYIDEAQHFVTSTLEQAFSEARKFNLSLTIANQFLKQLAGKTLDAVMGNVGALVTFQSGGDDDARELAHYMKPHFAAEDLLNLDKFQTAVWLRYRGQQQPAFSLTPQEPFQHPRDGVQREARIRQLSIQTYTPKNRQTVLDWLKQRYAQTHEAMSDEGYDPLYDPLH